MTIPYSPTNSSDEQSALETPESLQKSVLHYRRNFSRGAEVFFIISNQFHPRNHKTKNKLLSARKIPPNETGFIPKRWNFLHRAVNSRFSIF
jgi:hypothetical protein